MVGVFRLRLHGRDVLGSSEEGHMSVADLGLPEGREGAEKQAVVGMDWRGLGGSLDGCSKSVFARLKEG